MKKAVPFLFLISFTYFLQAQIPTGYYNGTEGLSGDDLRFALRSIITSGQQNNNYDDLYFYYQSTDNFGSNKVWDMYSMDGQGNASYYFYFNSNDECGTYSGEGDCYNREHSVPESWMGTGGSVADADLFVVIPTDGYVNNHRSNLPYGENNGEDYTSTNGSKKGNCTYPGFTSTCFEPIDVYKGDFARAYFYVVTRYNVSDWGGASFSGDGFSTWTKNMLLEWNEMDPVSQKEIDRNNAVYGIQHNRNPYIDHPEWVCEVFSSNCGTVMFTSSPITTAIENVPYSYNVSFQGTGVTATCTTLPSWLNFEQGGASTASLWGTPSVNDIGVHNVSIFITDGTNSAVQDFTITVTAAAGATIINEDFTTCPPNGWTIYSEQSNSDWHCSSFNGNQYFEANAFGADMASNDWFISPSLNLNNYDNEIFIFDTWTKYSDAGVTFPEVRLKYSVNYSGTGSPSNATWTELNYNFPAENSQIWTSSGNVDLSQITGNSVYLAFHYTSSGTTSGTCAQWEVDNMELTGDYLGAVNEVLNNVRLYPNPAKNTLKISTEDEITYIEIYSITGTLLHKENTSGTEIDVNILSFPKGIYCLKIISKNKEIINTKFIKD